MGREGEGGGGGEYEGGCLFHDDHDEDEYDDDNECNGEEDGKGRVGELMTGGNLTMTVATSTAGRPSAAWGGVC